VLLIDFCFLLKVIHVSSQHIVTCDM